MLGGTPIGVEKEPTCAHLWPPTVSPDPPTRAVSYDRIFGEVKCDLIPRGAADGEALAKAGHGSSFFGMDVKNSVKLGGQQHIPDAMCHLQKLYLATKPPRRSKRRDQFADPGAVHVVHFGQVHNDPMVAVVKERAQRLAQKRRAIAQRELAARVHDHDFPHKSRCCTKHFELSIRRWLPAQPLSHHQFGATLARLLHLEFVHKGPHQENSAAGTLEQVFIGERVRHVFYPETAPLIPNRDDELFLGELKRDEDLLPALLLAAVIIGVDYSLAHRHADLKAIVIVKSHGGCDPRAHFFGQAHAIEQRFEGQVDSLMPGQCSSVMVGGQFASMGNTRAASKSMQPGRYGGASTRLRFARPAEN